MLLSRFWYVLLSLVLGAAVFSLYLAQSMYNRAGAKTVAEELSSDSQVVSWYMRNVSRERSAQLIKFALHPDVARSLVQASAAPEVPRKARARVNSALSKLNSQVPKEYSFDAVLAVDQHGRVVGQVGFLSSHNDPNFELGGYPVVADALHGYIRDDTFVWDRVQTVVARPVQFASGDLPVGAVVGLRTIDDNFANDIARRTGAAIAFYRAGERVASAAPDDFDRARLDGIITDLGLVESDQDYQQKGRSKVRYLDPTLGVVYTRLPGEAWVRGAGYVVGRAAQSVGGPFAFFGLADDKDKAEASLLLVALLLLLGIGGGLGLTFLEHTRPMRRFSDALADLAAGKDDQVPARKLSGVFRKLAAQINDGIDHAVAKGGGSRRAADLNQVLGDIPEQPAMSAFRFPEPSGTGGPSDPEAAPAAPKSNEVQQQPSMPLSRTMPEASGVPPQQNNPPLARRGAPSPPRPVATPGGVDYEAEWRDVFRQFVETKHQCGEPTEGLTYEKFEGTLKRNRDAIMQQHGVSRVIFSVYVKAGRAALKANPLKG